MRHLTIRLQLAWLTICAVAAFVIVAAFNPGGVVDAELATNTAHFRAALGGDPSIETLNLFRAQLAADMVFLIAYGLLLRQSVVALGVQPGATPARRAVIVVMMADAFENVGALMVIRSLTDDQAEPGGAVFLTMNAAALIKWALAGLVLLFLARGWWRYAPSLDPALRRVGQAAAVLFAAGGVGSVLVVVSIVVPAVRTVASSLAVLAPALALLLQFRLLDLIGGMLRFVYLARVPVAALLVVTAFGPVALGPATALLGGILDVAGSWGIGVVTAAGLVLAFACGTQINLVRAYGAQRTFDPTLRVLRHRVMTRAVSGTVLVATGSLLFSIALASLRVTTVSVIAGVVGGVVAGVLFLFVVELIAARWSGARPARTLPQLAVPFFRAPLLGSWLRDAHDEAPSRAAQAVKMRAARWSLAGKLFGLASGYIELDEHGRRRLLRGHTFAAIQLIVSGVFYVALVNRKLPGDAPSPEAALWVPTAGSLVLLLLLCSWVFAGVTFFLDRYRMPLLTAVAGLLLVTGSRTWTDHAVLAESPSREYTLATPAEVLRAYPQPIVVAAAGGGIQAGAWTARALPGIDNQLQGALRDRLALVSSVSGGSMGALYYGAFEGAPADATARAMEPSLDQVASALISSDLVRVFGMRWGADRGVALERSWASRLPDVDATLRGWSQRVSDVVARGADAQPFPAFLFNATVVETGQPVAFATTQFPTESYRATFSRELKQYPVVESVAGLFGLRLDGERVRDVGLHVVTAARLSAAFPYVSPAATIAIADAPRYHLVDGGYYDNYGLLALSQWLDDALEGMDERPARIDVLIVRGLVGSESDVDRDLRASEDAQKLRVARAQVPPRGWAWQITAPPVAFLNTRTFGQWAGGNQVLKLLTEKWARRGVTIVRHLYDYPVDRLPPACRIAPLSWKLSVPQQGCIQQGWDVRDQGTATLTLAP